MDSYPVTDINPYFLGLTVKAEVKISPFGLDGVIVCTPSGPILDEFPQRPSRYYFALKRKLLFDRAFVSFT